MAIQLTGSIPGLINENTPLWDWMGQLRLSMDPSLIRFVDITGTGADYFDATLNRATGMITIAPIAQADYESFSASGRSPTLSLGLRFFMADGTVQTSASNYSVTVLNLDDTAPQSLRFSSGGKVEANQAGAVIGALAVTDPDTISGFTYTIREDDQWVFEVVNGVLKLRAGISLSVTDGPMRSVVIDVWDGHQSSAFTLDFQVTLPGSGGQAIDLFESHERIDAFYWSNGSIIGNHMSWEIASLRDQGDYTTLAMRDGTTLIFSEPTSLQLLDGVVYFSGDSKAAWLWSVADTVLNREATNTEMFWNYSIVGTAVSQRDFVNILLGSAEFQQNFGVLNNKQFVERLYLNTTGEVSASGVTYHTGRLDNGYARADLVLEFMTFRKGLGQTEARADQGIFVPNFNAQQIDVLLRAGGGTQDAEQTRFWSEYYAAGLVSIAAIADGITHSPAFAAQMGALDTRNFVQQFTLKANGSVPEAWFTDLFTSVIDSGAMTRGQFMAGVVSSLDTHESFVYQRPDGAAFGNPW